MAEFTPGPWRVGTGEPTTVWKGPSRDDSGPLLARCANVHEMGALSDEEERANARLMASAPDLLAVVRQVEDLAEAATYVGYLREGVPEHTEAIARRDEILDQARAALAKAGGS